MPDAPLLRALAELAQLCADRPDRGSFLAALVQDVLRPLDARAGGIGILDDEGLLEIRTMHGFPTGTLRNGPRFPLTDTLPLTDAVRTGRIIIGTYVDIVSRYPALAAYAPRGTQAHYLPLRFRGEVIGGMSIGTEHAVPERFADHFWSSVAAMTALVVVSADPPASRERARRHDVLTPRQLQILGHLRAGRTNAQIAHAMNFGRSTIAHDIMRVFAVLGADNRREAVEIAERSGLLGSPPSDS